MAVVKLKSTIFGVTGVNGYQAPDSSALQGVFHRVAGRVTNGATDNTGSTYLIAQIPWAAILLHDSRIRTDAWGFAQAVVGTPEDPDGLYDAAKGASATGVVLFDVFTAKWNQPLWKQLGLAKMPNKPFAELMFVARADATGAGTADFDIRYALHI
ncbi:hypothetical protein [Pseudogemmobacter bohemicus]|uniref:hypothetical protein n=1 Tax=Pseudogemmobacter bohemicus TaxID=2250708 RepID=UPI000DD4E390|nr:hypothetical protein [Pseudogemmobacter bohemicus]